MPEPRALTVHDRVAGSLLGLFCGDALGMPFETWPADAIPERLEMLDARLGRGRHTDDTQMAIALCESLLRCGRVDEEDLAAAILEAFDPRRGYGPGTTTVVELWRAGVPVRDAAPRLFGGEGSAGNGAAMRVAPVGLLFAHEPERCVAQARAQARLTHAHPLGIDGAAAVAAAVGAAVRGDDHLAAAREAVRTAEFEERLARAADLAGRGEWAAAGALGATVAALHSVPAALLAAAAPGFEAALTCAVRCGGDTDTVAAMAGAVAGARFGAGAIPARWLDALEDGARGRSHVEGLAARLAALVSAT
ncbi:MAG TPA: ADP-ribosylglycohydrolase family protein [Solirubrobacteraceae bacterium]|nr:ADP-ribosylglycohydrolase family protein [Solirubrobacteraceae bacterium]